MPKEMTKKRVNEIAYILVLEQAQRGVWGTPPEEIKLYLCHDTNQTGVTITEAKSFITKIANST